MAQLKIRESTPTDSHAKTVVRLPTVLSAGGGEQLSATPLHDHPGDELVFIERGPVVVHAAGHRLQGDSGGWLLVPKGCIHDQQNFPGTCSWFVVFNCRGRRFPRSPRLLHLAVNDPLAIWFPQLCQQHLASDGVGTAIAALLLAVLERLAVLDARSVADHALPLPIKAAMRMLEQNTAEEMTAAAIAAIAGVSPSHLRALFQQHLGMSPRDYHCQLRLDLAAKLLRTSYLSVGAVAAACGWQDANYFGRIFSQRFADSPRAWRSRHRV